MPSKSPQELHAHACRVVFRIVGVEALAVRHVHTPQGHGKFLPVVQSIGKSGAVPEHELVTGSPCAGEISVVEKDTRAPIQRSRNVPAVRELGPNCQNGSCTGRGAIEGLVFERTRLGRAGRQRDGSERTGQRKASIELEIGNIKSLYAEEKVEVRRADLAFPLDGSEL